MVNCPTDTGANPWVPHVVGWRPAAPNSGQRHSDRSVRGKLQAVISSHPTRYLGGSSCTWHILLETPERVTKEPTHLAWQRKWKQSNQSETCSLPHHISWPLHRWASKLYACAAALVARRQPVQVCREASRNALRIHRLTDALSMFKAGMQDARAQRNHRNHLRTRPQRKQWLRLQDLPRMRGQGRLGKTLLHGA